MTHAIDLSTQDPGSAATILGIVDKIRHYPDHTYVAVSDFSGTVDVSVLHMAPDVLAELKQIKPGFRVQVEGLLAENSRSKKFLQASGPPVVLSRNTHKLDSLDGEMRFQSSRMLLSRLKNGASSVLAKSSFTEFESRVISTEWPAGGLEPLRVVYPGFGSPATLATSPLPQVMEFIETTSTARAFTFSRSFATTFRDRHSSTESVVLGARALDLDLDGAFRLLTEIVRSSLGLVAPSAASVIPVELSVNVDPITLPPDGEFSFIVRSIDRELPNDFPIRILQSIFQMTSPDRRVMAEGSVEALKSGRRVVSFVIYLEQLLPLLDSLSIRQLRDLGRFNAWSTTQGGAS